MVQIGNDWDELLAGEFEKDYYQNIGRTRFIPICTIFLTR